MYLLHGGSDDHMIYNTHFDLERFMSFECCYKKGNTQVSQIFRLRARRMPTRTVKTSNVYIESDRCSYYHRLRL